MHAEPKAWQRQPYQGYEVGPIRPPSEAHSLLLRVSRNCSWNKCTFCGLYKTEQFSLRPVDHILEDIRAVKRCVDAIQNGQTTRSLVKHEQWAFYVARTWVQGGMASVFLQDANSLIVKPNDLIAVMEYLRELFPEIQRITSYARSHTLVRIKDADLQRLADAGLNRIHVGMESASDTVLSLVKKGTDKATQICAGQKVKAAGIELSEYYMPGLGGVEHMHESALETADALNQINPDFIRIRTLAIPQSIPLAADYEAGLFQRATDVQKVEELRLMLANLKGITSCIKSDHILNMLPEVDGVLPRDHKKILGVIDRFLELPAGEQNLYRFGRRMGYINQLDDLLNQERCRRIVEIMHEDGVTSDTIDDVSDILMKRFI